MKATRHQGLHPWLMRAAPAGLRFDTHFGVEA